MNPLDMAELYRSKTLTELHESLSEAQKASRQALEDGTEAEFLQCSRVEQAVLLAISLKGGRS